MATTMATTGEAAGGQVLSALNPSDIHVLLVDDERLTRLVVGNLLRTCKYKVTIAESGTQALEILSKAGPGAFQLILTDVMMPDVGGLELLRFVRSHQHLYNVPVIMMSASEAQETMCAALMGSADEYLVKPVTRKEVQNIWMHVMKRYHHAAAVQPAVTPEGWVSALEAHQDPGSSSAVAAAAMAVTGSAAAAGCSGAAVGSLVPLASSAGPLLTGFANGGPVTGVGGPGLPSRGPLLSLGQGGSLGLSPEVARDMMRAAALAASTTAASAAGASAGGACPAAGHRRTLPSGTQASEEGEAPAGGRLEMDSAAAPGHQRGAQSVLVEGAGLEMATAGTAIAVGRGSSPSHPSTTQQHHPTQHQEQNAPQPLPAGCPGQAVGGHGGGGHGASKVNLLKWLRRSNRCVQPKESFWIFCEVLLLVDSCQAATGSRPCGLRPSKLVLFSNGHVAFASPPSPPLAASAAAVTAVEATRPVKRGNEGDSDCPDGRKKRRRHSGGQLRSAEGEHALSAGGGSGGCQAEQGQEPHSTRATAMACTGATKLMIATGNPSTAANAVGSRSAPETAAPAVVAMGSSEDEEDALYRSPEEIMGQPATPASDMFSLGLLFFELFYVCTGGERAVLLRDARQRVLPPAFSRQQPKEAAFALALLHPDPACRPTLGELLGSAMFRATCASLRQKALRPGPTGPAATTAGGADATGREYPHTHSHQQHRNHRQANHHRQPSHPHRGEMAAAVVTGSGRSIGVKQSQQHVAHRLANGSNGSGRGVIVEGSAGPEATKRPAGSRLGATDPSAAHGGSRAGPTLNWGAPLRVNDAILLEFLRVLQKRKMEALAQVDAELAFLTADAQMVEQYLLYLHQTRSAKRQRGGGGGCGASAGSIAISAASGGGLAGALATGNGPGAQISITMPPPPPLPAQVQQKTAAGDAGTSAVVVAGGGESGTGERTRPTLVSSGGPGLATAAGAGGTPSLPHSAAWSEQHQAAQSKWCRIAHKYDQLEPVFLERCRPPPATPQGQQSSRESAAAAAVARRHADAGGLPEPLLRFAEDLAAFATFTTLTPIASLQYADPPASSSMVAGAAFDRDDEFFALAGVNKRIKIFEREAVMQSSIGTHYPVLEISSRSRLSSVTWSSYIKGHLASADYEGVVQLWDANTNSELMQFEEHRKRVWSIDFSQADPARLLSGGDDGLVKLWSIQQETSITTIELNANVCSVQFSPISPHLIAASCANSRIFLYDIRNTANPLHVLSGHTRAVSYVRFLSPTRLVSASTDNTLRLWQLDGLWTATDTSASSLLSGQPSNVGPVASCVQVFRGHVNQRNFTGLSVSPDGHISCGSENNRVFCYYQSLPMPVTSYDFSLPEADVRGNGGGAAGDTVGAAGGGADAGAGQAAATGGLVSAVSAGSGALNCGTSGASKSGSRSGTGQFVSSVCWSRRSNLLLAANSMGLIKLFTLQ